jgi:hypothetical protein
MSDGVIEAIQHNDRSGCSDCLELSLTDFRWLVAPSAPRRMTSYVTVDMVLVEHPQ